MATVALLNRPRAETVARTAFLVVDTESVPDGRLLGMAKYGDEGLTPEEAIERAQAEARETSRNHSDFLPVSFQYPIAVCVVRVARDFSLEAVSCLDAPHYRPRDMVRKFWAGVAYYTKAKLVTFNGRGFDLPLLEMAAFRYGCSARDYFQNSRNRFNGHVDLLDWLNNYGAARLAGGLNVLSKLLGKPGKMEMSGDQVYGAFRAGKLREINEYCMFDTLDTYFVFLRTRVLTGDLTLEQEYDLTQQAKAFLTSKVDELPALAQYLQNWADWAPWP
jgi:predicted PolB exonuclease-like 3'-5' exonuclease